MGEHGAEFRVEELLREAGWVRALARGLADAPERAEELEQETWLAALRARPATDRGLRPWLATVMRNVLRAGARGERHRAARERDAARGEALPSARELAERADLQRALVEHVLALDEPFRATVLLCFYEGLAPAEIARRQGVPAATVRSRLARGIERLRERLDRRCGGERSRWLAALAPLAGAREPWKLPEPWIAGGIAVKKLAVAVVAIAALAVLWTARERLAPAAPQSVGIVADSEPAAPADARGSDARSLPAEPLDAGRSAVADAPVVAAPDLACRVRLVDERTGEPLPDFRIARIDGTPAPAILTSDAAGELLVSLAPGAKLRFDVLENLGGDDLIQTHRGAGGAPVRGELARERDAPQPLELRLPAGPTYRLGLAPPVGYALADLRASLRSADARHAFDVANADLRDGAQPWVRFRPAAYLVEPGPPWKLEVVSRDALWYGSALVQEREGVAQESVRIELEPRARLFGRMSDSDGKPIAKQYVRIERDGASFADASNRPLFGLSDAEGRYALRAVPPGEWNVIVAVDGRREHRTRLALAPLEARELDLTLEALPPEELARIAGTVESATGAYRDAVYVSVARVGGRESSGARTTWSELDGRAVGSFAVEGLKPGRYRVSARVPGFLAVEPASLEVETGGAPPRFVVRDDVEQVELFFRAAAGGRALDEFRVRLAVESGGEPLESEAAGRNGLALVQLVPRGARCAYVVRAEGFQPVWGELVADGSLTRELPLAVALEPGWGIEVRVVDSRRRPLAGARVSFDGEFAAETGVDGRARVVRDAKPARVAIEYRDWRPSDDTPVSPETGSFRSWMPELVVEMVPR